MTHIGKLEFDVPWPGKKLVVGGWPVPYRLESEITAEDLFALERWAHKEARALQEQHKEAKNG